MWTFWAEIVILGLTIGKFLPCCSGVGELAE
jgi:hypothetical protein